MIVLKKADTFEYLQSPYQGYLTFGKGVDSARQFDDLEDFQNNTHDWERDALSLLMIEVITIL